MMSWPQASVRYWRCSSHQRMLLHDLDLDEIRMKLTLSHILSTCLLGTLGAMGGAQAAPADAELLALVQRHAQAQNNFDQVALKATTAENYVEISPVGEVDGREKMLSFYAPEQKRPSPQLQVDEPLVRLFGDTAVISARAVLPRQSGRGCPYLRPARRVCGSACRQAMAAGQRAVHGHPSTKP